VRRRPRKHSIQCYSVAVVVKPVMDHAEEIAVGTT
jgi:hypothetical protein